jgi:phage shock protein A
VQTQLVGLDQQRQQLETEQQKLTEAEQRLSAKVEAFRTQKETVKAQYTAAEAQVKINEAFGGISEEMADVGLSLQRAQDKTEQMQARAGAIDELLASGALEDMTQTGDPIAQTSEVDAELAAMKKEIGPGEGPPEQIGSGQPS